MQPTLEHGSSEHPDQPEAGEEEHQSKSTMNQIKEHEIGKAFSFSVSDKDNNQMQEEKCQLCGANGDNVKLKKCTSCHSVNYCNTQCQRADWKSHRVICRRI